MWEIEFIDDVYSLYVRVHKSFISSKDGKPRSSAFTNTPKDGDNLSSDWSKYCSPQSARALIGKQKKFDGTFKKPELFFMWELNVGKIRKVNPTQSVQHDPVENKPELDGLPNNRAHSIIIGDKPINNAEFRVSLYKAGDWIIKPEK